MPQALLARHRTRLDITSLVHGSLPSTSRTRRLWCVRARCGGVVEHLHTMLCRVYSGKPLLERCDVCLALSCVDTRESLLIGCVHLGELHGFRSKCSHIRRFNSVCPELTIAERRRRLLQWDKTSHIPVQQPASTDMKPISSKRCRMSELSCSLALAQKALDLSNWWLLRRARHSVTSFPQRMHAVTSFAMGHFTGKPGMGWLQPKHVTLPRDKGTFAR